MLVVLYSFQVAQVYIPSMSITRILKFRILVIYPFRSSETGAHSFVNYLIELLTTIARRHTASICEPVLDKVK
jgi:hypothetical protein